MSGVLKQMYFSLILLTAAHGIQIVNPLCDCKAIAENASRSECLSITLLCEFIMSGCRISQGRSLPVACRYRAGETMEPKVFMAKTQTEKQLPMSMSAGHRTCFPMKSEILQPVCLGQKVAIIMTRWINFRYILQSINQ